MCFCSWTQNKQVYMMCFFYFEIHKNKQPLTSHASQELFRGNCRFTQLFPDEFLPYLNYFSLRQYVVGWPNVQCLVQGPRVIYGLDSVHGNVIFININCCRIKDT